MAKIDDELQKKIDFARARQQKLREELARLDADREEFLKGNPAYSKQDFEKPHTQIEEDPIKCPRCGGSQIAANKKGFGLGKAVAGGFLLGPVGLLGGFLGSNKIKITCLKCGHQWKP